MTGEPVEVITATVLPPARLGLSEKSAEIPTKPISERAFAMTELRKRDDHTTESTEVERLPVAELRASNDSLLAATNPPAVVSGGVSHGIEVGVGRVAVSTGAQVYDIDDNATGSLLTRNFHPGFTRHGRRAVQI